MKRILAVLAIVLLSSILILGCDGGDELSDTSVDTSFTPEDAVVLSGVVATHEPLQGVVQAINTRGETTEEVTANSDGRFTLELSNHPPFLVRMMHHGKGIELFSFAASGGHINLTPLTDLAMYLAVGGEIALQDLFHEWDGSQLSPEEVQMATSTVNANLASLLQKQNLDDKTYDFFRTDFHPDGTGIDAVLDQIRIAIDAKAETLSGAVRILDASGQELLTFDPAPPPPTAAPSSALGHQKDDGSQ